MHRTRIVRTLVTTMFAASIILTGSAAAQAGDIRQVALGVSRARDRSFDDYREWKQLVGRAPAIWSIWSDWGGSSRGFPDRSFLNKLADRGTVPIIIWQPVDPQDLNDPRFAYKEIIAGDFNRYIRNWARDAADWGKPMLMRFAHEMDGYWFPWGVTRGTNTPARFINAWRHIHGIFEAQGATNVTWVWSPNAPCGGCAPYSTIYPGDAYVDYAAFSAFNWGGDRWREMEQLYEKAYNGIKAVTDKPIIVAETGSNKNGGNKPEWIRKGYPDVYDAYPRIKAIIYFDLDMRFQEQPNWLLTAPAQALTSYRDLVVREKFQGSIQ